MTEIVVDDCRACEPVTRLVNQLLEKGFVIVEKRIEDYHFHQLYLKLQGNLTLVDSYSVDGFARVENTFICNCHWSSLEVTNSVNTVYFC
ncbi:hypothetical protein LV89_01146 [Arcicella aurantiaca]|uniref:Uncharacterized protein n=1 Tax=Arcicella aurantiaca TaxID=591202 RepID=A0A316EF88_9BACT|nr:hypothetical protein [Arcicella aurantiaca]PWK28362.1 hypothetical protein LV89_01146 [Arcicella aurantiaca]